MKSKNKLTTSTLAALATLAAASSAQAVLLYSDTFDDTDVAVNSTGVGGGMGSGTGTQTVRPIVESGGSIGQDSTASGGNQGGAWSSSAFSIANGFTLNVTFDITSQALTGNPPYPSNSFSFGLLDVASSFDDVTLSFIEANGNTATTQYGIGLNLTERQGANLGLNFANGSALSVLDQTQNVTTGVGQTFSLSVDALGNYSYSLNGATASTGTTTLDLTRDYHFTVLSQGANGGSQIQDVSLDAVAIPEPSSTLLLGLGGLALILRKRR